MKFALHETTYNIKINSFFFFMDSLEPTLQMYSNEFNILCVIYFYIYVIVDINEIELNDWDNEKKIPTLLLISINPGVMSTVAR